MNNSGIRYFWMFVFLLAISSCAKKEETTKPPVSTNEFILPDPPQYGSPFPDIPATEDIVMYEVNLRAFSPKVGIQGVINKLEHIKSLDVKNVIWLMPVFR
ncbi:MAG: hypothetical protein IPF68_15110 [Bacteroidales bacterium]|nr:hypothetical protein [Bacteroidales bacterium]